MALHEAGLSRNQIARTLSIPKSTVSYNIRKVAETGRSENALRPGRPRCTSRREDTFLKMQALSHRFAPAAAHAKSLQERTGKRVSRDTVRRRLDEAGLHSRVAKKKPLLSAKNMKLRLQWAKARLHWTADDWGRVVWSDESKFTLFSNCKRRLYVRRRPTEAYSPECLQPTVKFGGKGVMVWGCFSRNGVGVLHRVPGIMTQDMYLDLLQNVGLPSAMSLRGLDYIFQQDNDPKHTASKVKYFFDNLPEFGFPEFTVMDWPSQSPDLNPVEHLWDEVERRLRRQPVRITTPDALFVHLRQAWNSIEADVCERLVSSMPERVRQVIANKGGATSY